MVNDLGKMSCKWCRIGDVLYLCGVSISRKIAAAIERFPEGELFQYEQLGLEPGEYSGAVKAMSRMVKTGRIRRVSTGRYYKPEKSVFGELRLSEEQQLKPYLFSGSRRLAYVTGEALYNRMGLTTQVPVMIRIASRDKRIITKVNNLTVKSVKSYVDVSEDNYFLLEILDALKDFRIIPDLDTENALFFLEQKIDSLGELGRQQLAAISLKYPPRTRALLGSFLDRYIAPDLSMSLKNSLNPLSTYRLGISEVEWPGVTKWNIY
jgi:hypothetical protein